VADDVVPSSDESTRIVFASLYTYTDAKDETAFQKINLPPICIGVGDLHDIFYQTKLKRFSPFALNKLVSKLGKPALIDAILSNYETQTGNDRMNLTAQQKILLRQEISTANINGRIQKIVHFDNLDFIESFDDENMWFDEVAAVEEVSVDGVVTVPYAPWYHSVRTSIEINVFSESLQTGITLVVHFTVYINGDFQFALAPSSAPVAYNSSIEPTIQTPKCGLCVSYDASNSA